MPPNVLISPAKWFLAPVHVGVLLVVAAMLVLAKGPAGMPLDVASASAGAPRA